MTPGLPGPSAENDPDGDVFGLDEGSSYRAGHRPVLTNVVARLKDQPPLESHRLTPPLGGIVIPISRDLTRPLPGLRLGVRLALENSCPLVVIVSQAARISDFPTEVRHRLGDQLVLIDLGQVDPAWRPKLESGSHYLSTQHRANDVGGKRNLGLLAAVVMGWATVLFLDDDIFPARTGPTLDEEGLRRAVRALGENPGLAAIGWTSEEFNDNSVIGHARPYCGRPQGVFIGGGALLVRTSCRVPFFPDIYNEDWLFLIAVALAAPDPRAALGWAGRVHQEPYEPFSEKRAKSEEAGEVIGEGLMNRLEDLGAGMLTGLAPETWRGFLKARALLIEQLREHLAAVIATVGPGGGPADPAVRQRQIRRVLGVALRVSRKLKAVDLQAFVEQWDADRRSWRDHLVALTRDPQNRIPPDDEILLALRSASRAGRAELDGQPAGDRGEAERARPDQPCQGIATRGTMKRSVASWGHRWKERNVLARSARPGSGPAPQLARSAADPDRGRRSHRWVAGRRRDRRRGGPDQSPEQLSH